MTQSTGGLNGWEDLGVPIALRESWESEFGPNPAIGPPTIYVKDDLRALVGREPVGPWPPVRNGGPDMRWHISVVAEGRVPTWDEMVDAAHSLRPGVMFCIPMPPPSFWINEHEHVLHVWEIRDPNLEDQWRSEGRAR
jgi:hypothetical protein